MRILSVVKNLAGTTGGVAVYFIIKKAACLLNRKSRRKKLTPWTITILQPLFPCLDLARVRIMEGASIPPNWFRKTRRFSAITFGYTIYTTGTEMQGTNEKINIIIHELVHTEQVRRRADCEARFASDYARGFLAAGNYRDNLLEKEAFDFTEINYLPESQTRDK